MPALKSRHGLGQGVQYVDSDGVSVIHMGGLTLKPGGDQRNVPDRVQWLPSLSEDRSGAVMLELTPVRL